MSSLLQQFKSFKQEAETLKKERLIIQDREQKLILERDNVQEKNRDLLLKNEFLKLQIKLMKNQIDQQERTITRDEKETKETEYKIIDVKRHFIQAECVHKIEKVLQEHQFNLLGQSQKTFRGEGNNLK